MYKCNPVLRGTYATCLFFLLLLVVGRLFAAIILISSPYSLLVTLLVQMIPTSRSLVTYSRFAFTLAEEPYELRPSRKLAYKRKSNRVYNAPQANMISPSTIVMSPTGDSVTNASTDDLG